MSTLNLTDDQKTAKDAFAAKVAAGCQSQIGGFQLDPDVPVVYTLDFTGKVLLATGALKDVDLAKVNPSIKPAPGSPALPIIKSMPMSWDMNGVAKGNQAFNLVQVVS